MSLTSPKTGIKPEIKDRKTDEEFVKAAKSRLSQSLRVGIVGSGLMGKWHANAARRAGGLVVGVADTNQIRAVELAKYYPDAQTYGDLKTMLEQKSLDVLHICTPTPSHYSIAELALKTGVNLFIEKPLAPTAVETIHLYDIAAAHNASLCPAHQFIFQNGVERAKKMILSIGNIIHLQATLCSAGGAGMTNKFLDSTAVDILPHPLSLFQKILNGLLSEDEWDVSHPQSGELRINGFAGEISLTIFVSMNARPTVNSLLIIGTDGTIHLDLFHDFAVLEKGNVSKMRKILHPFDLSVKKFSAAAFNLARRAIRAESAYPGLNALISIFYQTIRDGAESPISPAQAINIARIRDFLIYRANIN